MKTNWTIAIASGKGGTGKTTTATNLAIALQDTLPLQLIDCDVEEPNSHLFLHPTLDQTQDVGIPTPVIDAERCLGCRRCSDFCVFNAISFIGDQVMIFPELCHGCGGCSYICPAHAISTTNRVIGWIDVGRAEKIDFAHGRLKIGTPLAPPIISELKEMITEEMLTIIDAPPGTSCSVVNTLYGVDYVILVTEPTPFGLYDLQLTVQVVRKLGLPMGVILNKGNLGNQQVVEYCEREEIPLLMEIPFKKEYAACYAKGQLLVEKFPPLKGKFQEVFSRIVRDKEE